MEFVWNFGKNVSTLLIVCVLLLSRVFGSVFLAVFCMAKDISGR